MNTFGLVRLVLTGVNGTTTFSGNLASGGAGGADSSPLGTGGDGGNAYGAALLGSQSFQEISHASFDRNAATGGDGGSATNASGISATGGAGGQAFGGAIDVETALDLSADTLTDNTASGGAGGSIGGFTGTLGQGGNALGGAVAVQNGATLSVNSSTLNGNTARAAPPAPAPRTLACKGPAGLPKAAPSTTMAPPP